MNAWFKPWRIHDGGKNDLWTVLEGQTRSVRPVDFTKDFADRFIEGNAVKYRSWCENSGIIRDLSFGGYEPNAYVVYANLIHRPMAGIYR